MKYINKTPAIEIKIPPENIRNKKQTLRQWIWEALRNLGGTAASADINKAVRAKNSKVTV